MIGLLLTWVALASSPVHVALAAPGVDDPGGPTRALEREEILSVTASTTLASSSARYAAENLVDGDPATAWVEGVDGLGVGAWVELRLKSALPIESATIWPGYLRSEALLRDNARPSRIRLTTDAGDDLRIEIPDPPPGWPNGPGHRGAKVELSGKPVTRVRIVIEAAHPGAKFADTAISELRLDVLDP